MQEPQEIIELSVSCDGLPRDTSRYYFAAVFEFGNGVWMERGRTEGLNVSEPRFNHPLKVTFKFERIQNFKIVFYYHNKKNVKDLDLKRTRYLGEVDLKLSQLIGSRKQQTTLPIIYPKKKNMRLGVCTIFAEEVDQNNPTQRFVTFRFAGKKLAKKDFFGKSDPYLELYKINENNTFTPVGQTEYIKGTLNPRWKHFKISLSRLCGGDEHRPLKVVCWDWNKNDKPDFMGEFKTTLNKLINVETSFPLIEPEIKKKKKKYKNSGWIYNLTPPEFTEELAELTNNERGTFLQYLRGGCQLHLMIAIDLTVSNGNPNKTTSLHFYNKNSPNYLNQYQRAILTTCNVLLDYDSTKRVPVYGFGAIPPGSNQTSHCFPLNFNPQNPNCEGIQGIMSAYINSLSRVKFNAPTTFESVINMARRTVSQIRNTQTKQDYYIQLIICDGTVTRGNTPHLRNTIDQIVACTKLPLSIIVVGVGNEDFSDMVLLDADEDPLVDSRGNKMVRDILNFVPFRNYLNATQEQFSSKLLEEVPGQVCSYFELAGIKPNKPKRVNQMRQTRSTKEMINQYTANLNNQSGFQSMYNVDQNSFNQPRNNVNQNNNRNEEEFLMESGFEIIEEGGKKTNKTGTQGGQMGQNQMGQMQGGMQGGQMGGMQGGQMGQMGQMGGMQGGQMGQMQGGQMNQNQMGGMQGGQMGQMNQMGGMNVGQMRMRNIIGQMKQRGQLGQIGQMGGGQMGGGQMGGGQMGGMQGGQMGGGQMGGMQGGQMNQNQIGQMGGMQGGQMGQNQMGQMGGGMQGGQMGQNQMGGMQGGQMGGMQGGQMNQNQMGQMGGMQGGQMNQNQYKTQLEQLVNMGFTDQQKNIIALNKTNGNIEQAIQYLI
ncbi:copine [Anaeramoeba flamelloides]|uniref:Copine n=1 Tax=Anaeramoeba flamelloides TaxID=1746091 RepID=A0ABQ8YPJ1_9EUKA|nr:copine [Anaeramoeba flamelloides]